jgi:hypothetical protein
MMEKKRKNSQKKAEKVEVKEEVVIPKKLQKTDYVFAILLVFLGAVLLLNTTGVVEWSIWSVLWRFWPVLIVFAGLNIIFEGSRILSVLLAVLAIIAFGLIFIWSLAIADVSNLPQRLNIRAPMWIMHGQRNIHKTFVIPRDDANLVNKQIDIDMGIGSLEVRNDVIDDHAILDAEYHTNFGKPSIEEVYESEKLELSFVLGKESRFFSLGNISPEYSLLLGNDKIATDLNLKLGAGKTTIDFDEYNLRNLDIDSGAGSVNVKLANMNLNEFKINVGAGKFQLDLGENLEINRLLNVKVGAGKVTINLPKDVEFKIDAKLGVGSIKTPIKEMSGIGNEPKVIKSNGYDFAINRIDIVADVGVGQLILQ